jgi:uncharacterized protein (TIGR04255 family)
MWSKGESQMSHVCGQQVLYESRARLRGDEKAQVRPVRPKFDRPPLIEQAITVIFDELAGFSIGDFGRFWALIEHEFPECRQAPPLPVSIEQLGGVPFEPDVRLVVSEGETLPRCLYRHASSGEAVQVQNNRFTFNWAKLGAAPYPHSERTVERFVELFGSFEAFVQDRQLGPLNLTQCEITNVNIVPVTEFGNDFGDAPRAFQLPVFNPDGNISTETYMQAVEYLISGSPSPEGRVHVVLSPVINSTDQTLAYKLEITARSGHGSGKLRDVLEFFDTARTAINAAFLAHTTREMWATWGLRNG